MTESAPLFQAHGVTRRFGGLCAVSDFSLTLQPGELVGIIGPNGAGKTTLFNIITGIYRPNEGSLRFRGTELAGKTPASICELGIARTFQNIRLFRQCSVLENVRIAASNRHPYSWFEALLHCGRYHEQEARERRECRELLDLFGLAHAAEAPAASLPYGLQRRLEFARALAAKPALLLLDEPAAGMNPEEVHDLMQLIGRVRREFGLTVLLIEHNMALVMGICERLVVLDFGVTIATGNPEEIKNDPRVIEAYFGEADE